MNRRVRASTPRTTTGCANCRQRRIKCDEAKPVCERCRKSGWTCLGYSQSNNLAVSLTDVAARNTSVHASSITQYSLPFKIPGSQEERRALHYFSNFAAADLTGHIPSTFWSRTVLQRCQHDVPVRRAAVALGKVHMEYVTGSDPFAASDDSVEAYRKSVKALRNYLGRQSVPDNPMVLVCSVLFFCFDLVRGERRTSLRHLRSGLEILNEWEANKQAESNALETKQELIDVFARLDLQATMFDDGRVPVLQFEEHMQDYCALPVDDTTIPFESLDEAQQCLFPLLHTAFSFLVQHVPYKFVDINTVPVPVLQHRKQILERFDIWNRRLKLLEYYQKSLAGTPFLQHQRIVLSTAKLHFRTIRLLILHCLQDSIMHSAPSFDDEADCLLGMARDVLTGEGDSRTANVNPPKRCFYLQLGIVAPIFLLAMKTSKPRVVKAAMELLQAAKGRKEGFYDAERMANITESLAKMQEGRDSTETYVSVEERILDGQSLEWVLDDVMEVEVPWYWHDEERRWKGYDRLRALIA